MNLALAIDQFSLMRSRDHIISKTSFQAFGFIIFFNAPIVVTISTCLGIPSTISSIDNVSLQTNLRYSSFYILSCNNKRVILIHDCDLTKKRRRKRWNIYHIICTLFTESKG
jgi:hypothetical protein